MNRDIQPEDSFEDEDPFEEIERRMHIHQLKNEVSEIVGGEMSIIESPDAPSEVLEGFWEHVRDYEKALYTTLAAKWSEEHEPLPDAGDLSDDEVKARMWALIYWMASRGTYLEDTNHLSDRELYDYIRNEIFREQVKDLPASGVGGWHWSPVGSGSEEDMKIIFKYYADDAWRERWMEDWPDFEMPEKETPPYDRDKDLPQAVIPHYEWDDEDDEDDDSDLFDAPGLN